MDELESLVIVDPIQYLKSRKIAVDHPQHAHLAEMIRHSNEILSDYKRAPIHANLRANLDAKLFGSTFKALASKYGHSIPSTYTNNSVQELRNTIRKAYFDVRNRLDEGIFRASQSRVIQGHFVFWSWQSHFKESRGMIDRALESSVAAINVLLPESFNGLQILENWRPEDGCPELSTEIANKIRSSLVFVGDVTPILVYENKEDERRVLYPNPNVCTEVGMALDALDPRGVVLLRMQRKGEGFGHAEMPFDFRNRPLISFDKKYKDLASDLMAVLLQILVNAGFIEEKSKDAAIDAVKIRGFADIATDEAKRAARQKPRD